ncbi:MAG TPA: serine hydrolase domain-containing protein [Chryseosolibacter sp.]|nr:serine hydrolase domain-containing protein [Chryseosolibacter sp.]
MKNLLLAFIMSLFFLGCNEHFTEEELAEDIPADTISDKSNEEDSTENSHDTTSVKAYFPPLKGNEWQTLSVDSLGWDSTGLVRVLEFVESKNTYGFIILHKGKIVVEKYWNGWNPGTQYPIASAGKSIAALLVGIAQQEDLLDINQKSSHYLGEGWTSLSPEKENMITVKHQLSMTTGLDETEEHCISPGCLKFKADAGSNWAYHNGPYNLLHHVIEKVSGMSMSQFTRIKLAEKIGLKNWTWEDYNLRLSTRDMARFGLLILNEGEWNSTKVLTDEEYFNSMLSSSNSLNESYGYLWWLNGKQTFMIPGQAEVFAGSLTASAPTDMISAMGMGDKKIYVIPSLDLVVVRHGDDTGQLVFGPSSFDSDLWALLMPVME